MAEPAHSPLVGTEDWTVVTAYNSDDNELRKCVIDGDNGTALAGADAPWPPSGPSASPTNWQVLADADPAALREALLHAGPVRSAPPSAVDVERWVSAWGWGCRFKVNIE